MYLPTSTLAILIGLFVILSPGLLLTIPGLSQTTIEDIGVAFVSGPTTTGAVTFCSSTSTSESECNKPTDIFVSGYTSVVSVLVHTIVFAAILYFLLPVLNQPSMSGTQILVFSLLFGLLAPGLLLTIPALSASDCGQNGKHIADVSGPANFYCSGPLGFPNGRSFPSSSYPNCSKCTSWFNSGETNFLPVIIHAIVFGLLVYYIGNNFV